MRNEAEDDGEREGGEPEREDVCTTEEEFECCKTVRELVVVDARAYSQPSHIVTPVSVETL